MSQEQQEPLFVDDEFEQLQPNMPNLMQDEQKAYKAFQDYLWGMVLITERRLKKHGLNEAQGRELAAQIIADIAHYQGGEFRYLPRADKLQQELRDIQMFRLWHDHGQTPEQVRAQCCPDINMVQVYKILRTKRHEYLNNIQGRLL